MSVTVSVAVSVTDTAVLEKTKATVEKTKALRKMSLHHPMNDWARRETDMLQTMMMATTKLMTRFQTRGLPGRSCQRRGPFCRRQWWME